MQEALRKQVPLTWRAKGEIVILVGFTARRIDTKGHPFATKAETVGIQTDVLQEL